MAKENSGNGAKGGYAGKANKVTDRQRLFVYEYVRDPNARKAAERAGYGSPEQIGPRLLDPKHYPLVALEVEKALEAKRAECEIDARRVVKELARLALFNPKRMFDLDGKMLMLSDLPDEVAVCIKEFEVSYRLVKNEEGEEVQMPTFWIKFWDKLDALRQLALHLGFAKDLKSVSEARFEWDRLYGRAQEADPLEAEIVEAEGRALPPPQSNEGRG